MCAVFAATYTDILKECLTLISYDAHVFHVILASRIIIFIFQLTNLLEKKHSSLREMTEQKLSQAAWVSVTTDLASVTTKGYLVVTGHYIGNYSHCCMIAFKFI